MKFRVKSKKNQTIYAPALGRRIAFKRGVYETDDRAEIALLSRHPRVSVEPESELEAATSDLPPEPVPGEDAHSS